MRQHLLVAAALAAAALAFVGQDTGSAAPAPPVPPLTGEELLASEVPDLIGASEVNGTCDPTATSTLSFTTNGEALGPYPGTFTESGTFTLGPGVFDEQIGGVNFTPVSFDATFTITSAVGNVTGTKTLSTLAPLNFGVCGSRLSQPGIAAAATAFNIQLTATYSAQITTSAGTFTDNGSSFVDYGDLGVRGIVDFQGFRMLESFVSESFVGAAPGKATGGGQVAPAVTFGFVAMQQPKGTLQGNCEVVDHIVGVDVKCLDVTDYSQVDNNAVFSGDATVNGAPTTYRIDVTDNGEPGTSDTFAIQTDGGYATGGPLTGGNVQVH